MHVNNQGWVSWNLDYIRKKKSWNISFTSSHGRLLLQISLISTGVAELPLIFLKLTLLNLIFDKIWKMRVKIKVYPWSWQYAWKLLKSKFQECDQCLMIAMIPRTILLVYENLVANVDHCNVWKILVDGNTSNMRGWSCCDPNTINDVHYCGVIYNDTSNRFFVSVFFKTFLCLFHDLAHISH